MLSIANEKNLEAKRNQFMLLDFAIEHYRYIGMLNLLKRYNSATAGEKKRSLKIKT